MLPQFRISATTLLAALAIAAAPISPAQALGKNERNFLKGVAAAAIVGAIIHDSRKRKARAEAPQYITPPEREYRRDRRENRRHRDTYDNRREGRVIGSDRRAGSGLFQTPAARAFNSYPASERRAIQRRLAAYGYYSGAIDGAFGPRTHQALYAFAQGSGRGQALESASTAFSLMDGLLG
ncbi:MAG: peptidoglycan-binding domain-containing protein [Pseudorhodobacter sp.]